jgi:hypothetical protein
MEEGVMLNEIDGFLVPLLPDVPGRDVARDETLLDPLLTFLLFAFSFSSAMRSKS